MEAGFAKVTGQSPFVALIQYSVHLCHPANEPIFVLDCGNVIFKLLEQRAISVVVYMVVHYVPSLPALEQVCRTVLEGILFSSSFCFERYVCAWPESQDGSHSNSWLLKTGSVEAGIALVL